MLTHRQATAVARHKAARKGIVLNLSASQLTKQGRILGPFHAGIAETLLPGLLVIGKALHLPGTTRGKGLASNDMRNIRS